MLTSKLSEQSGIFGAPRQDLVKQIKSLLGLEMEKKPNRI